MENILDKDLINNNYIVNDKLSKVQNIKNSKKNHQL
jgi:hypothetical protein